MGSTGTVLVLVLRICDGIGSESLFDDILVLTGETFFGVAIESTCEVLAVNMSLSFGLGRRGGLGRMELSSFTESFLLLS